MAKIDSKKIFFNSEHRSVDGALLTLENNFLNAKTPVRSTEWTKARACWRLIQCSMWIIRHSGFQILKGDGVISPAIRQHHQQQQQRQRPKVEKHVRFSVDLTAEMEDDGDNHGGEEDAADGVVRRPSYTILLTPQHPRGRQYPSREQAFFRNRLSSIS